MKKNNSSSIADLIDVIKSIDETGVFSLIAVTEKKANKKSRITGQATPTNLETVTKIEYVTVNAGHNYTSLVNLRRKHAEKDQDFKAKKTYATCISENGLLYQHINDPSRLYLRVYRNVNVSFITRVKYFDRGKEIVDWKKVQAEYFKKIYKSKAQELEDQDQIIVNNYKLSSIVRFKRSDFLYERTDIENVIEKLAI